MCETRRSSYRVPRAQVAALVTLFAFAPAAAGELFFDVVIRRDIPYGAVLWLAIAAWNAYWFLLRFAHAVDVEDGVLRWRAPLRSGTVDMADLRRVRPSWIFSNIEVMETAGGAPVLVWAVKGFRQLITAASTEHPVPCQLSLQARLADRLPVRSSFRGLDDDAPARAGRRSPHGPGVAADRHRRPLSQPGCCGSSAASATSEDARPGSDRRPPSGMRCGEPRALPSTEPERTIPSVGPQVCGAQERIGGSPAAPPVAAPSPAGH